MKAINHCIVIMLVFLLFFYLLVGNLLAASHDARPPYYEIRSLIYGSQETHRGHLIADKVTERYGAQLDSFGVDSVRVYSIASSVTQEVEFCLKVIRVAKSCVPASGASYHGASEVDGLYLDRGASGWVLGIPDSFGEYSGISPSKLESLLLAGLSNLMIELKDIESKKSDSAQNVEAAAAEWDGYPPPSN